MDMRRDRFKAVEYDLVRIALGKESRQRGEMGHCEYGMGVGEQGARAQGDRFDREVAEMIVKARAPMRPHHIGGLQHRPHPASGPAAHQPEVTPVVPRHQFENGIRLAVPPDTEDESVIAPLHGEDMSH
jgi:hypothetical protein